MREAVSLLFLAASGCLNSLACGGSFHLQVRQSNLCFWCCILSPLTLTFVPPSSMDSCGYIRPTEVIDYLSISRSLTVTSAKFLSFHVWWHRFKELCCGHNLWPFFSLQHPSIYYRYKYIESKFWSSYFFNNLLPIFSNLAISHTKPLHWIRLFWGKCTNFQNFKVRKWH